MIVSILLFYYMDQMKDMWASASILHLIDIICKIICLAIFPR